MDPWDVVVVGGGPAGLTAACRAAERGRRTLLLEKNRRPGNKILLSGGTRCNLTHATDARGIVAAFGHQGRFLHSALAALGPQAVVDLFEAEGVRTKIEPGGKIFPVSDRAADVLTALLGRLQRSGCAVALREPVAQIQRLGDSFQIVTAVRTIAAQAVVLVTGGQSYPGCGSTGDGYRWAAALGHAIVPPRPALVPITTHAPWVRALQGITVPDVLVRVLEPPAGPLKPRCLAQRRGALLLAHFGLSGPAALDVSRAVSSHAQPERLALQCDFLPDVTHQSLESHLREACGAAGKRLAVSILAELLPQRLAETIADRAGLATGRRAAELSRHERQNLVQAIKRLAIPITGTLGFRKAEVTAGGVALEEVDSRTMQSKRVPGLYFAGELLDLDGPIGGYNFQAAFSTGYLAGDKA
ncbi:MAG: NAD(P)/FAD-dependent oxidoreductase [Thermoguttaceae bacterium]|jgi:predicted Rossmann fold flavoprotein